MPHHVAEAEKDTTDERQSEEDSEEHAHPEVQLCAGID
jgi:hypothetical protein